MIAPFLVAETARAGNLGHCFLAPPGLPEAEDVCRAYVAAAQEQEAGGNFLAVYCPVTQRLADGAIRSGRDTLVLVGVDVGSLSVGEYLTCRKCLQAVLQERLEEIVLHRINWAQAGQSLVVFSEELCELLVRAELLKFRSSDQWVVPVMKVGMQHQPEPRSGHRQFFLAWLLPWCVAAAFAFAFLLPRSLWREPTPTGDPSLEADPTVQRASWNAVERSCHVLMEAGMIEAAFDQLGGWPVAAGYMDEVESLRSRLQKDGTPRALEDVRKEVVRSCQLSDWTSARSAINGLGKKRWWSDVSREWHQKLDENREYVDQKEDETLYLGVLRHDRPNKLQDRRSAATRYLDLAPVKSMKWEVKKYVSWLDVLLERREWGVRSVCTLTAPKGEYRVKLTLNGSLASEVVQVMDLQHPRTFTKTHYLKPADLQIEATVLVEQKDAVGPYRAIANITGSAPLTDYKDMAMEVKSADGKVVCNVSGQVDGLPVEPELKQWSSTQ